MGNTIESNTSMAPTTPNEVLRHALRFAESTLGLNIDDLFEGELAVHSKCIAWFIRVFGADHTTAANVWNNLETSTLVDTKVHKTGLHHFLMAIFFIKNYKTDIWNEVERVLIKKKRTILGWVNFYVHKIAMLGVKHHHGLNKHLIYYFKSNGSIVLHSLSDQMIIGMASQYKCSQGYPFYSTLKWQSKCFLAVVTLCRYQFESHNEAKIMCGAAA